MMSNSNNSNVESENPFPTNPAFTTDFVTERVGSSGSATDQGDQWKLRPKHIEALALMAEGLSNKQIADRMHITVGTVKTHITELFRRMNVERRGEAIILARRLLEVREQQRVSAERGEPLVNLFMTDSALREFKQGQILFRKGQVAHDLYYIKSGVVKLLEFDIDLAAGDVFGELGLFATNRQRTASARCETDVTAFVMKDDQVRDLHFRNPQFAWFLAATIATRIGTERARAANKPEQNL